MVNKRQSQSKTFLQLEPRIRITCPSFLAKQPDNPFSALATQLKLLNDSALYSIELDPRYYALKQEIEKTQLAYQQAKDTSQRLSLVQRLIQLHRQHRSASVAFDVLAEHQRWATLVQREEFWVYCHQQIVAGEQSSLEYFQQQTKSQVNYLNHDARALQYAAQHGHYCQQKLAQIRQNFSQLTRANTSSQKRELAQYIKRCQQQLKLDHEQLTWAILQRTALALAQGRLTTHDPIESLLKKLQRLGVLPPSAHLMQGPQNVSTTRELAFFMQYLFTHASADQMRVLDQLLQKHSEHHFCLTGTVSKPVLLPTRLESLYTHIVSTRRRGAWVRHLGVSFTTSKQALFHAMLFMPKIRLGEPLSAQVNIHMLWTDLETLQQLLLQNQALTWSQRFTTWFSRDFKSYTQQWQRYVSEKILAVVQAQLNYGQNILSGVWLSAREDLIEHTSQLAAFELRLAQCFTFIRQQPITGFEAQQQSLQMQLSELKKIADHRQTQKQTVCHVSHGLEQLLADQPLTPMKYGQLQQALLCLAPKDRRALYAKYFAPGSPSRQWLMYYFQVELFNSGAANSEVLSCLAKQWLGLIQQSLMDSEGHLLYSLFSTAMEQYRIALVSGQLTLERASAIKEELCAYFRSPLYLKEIITLPVFPKQSICPVMPNDSRSERVAQQLQSSQQLLEQTALLQSARPHAPQRLEDNAMDPSRIAKALVERLRNQPLVLHVQ